MKSLSHVQLLATPAYQAPLSMGFSRQEYWSGVPLPSLDAGTDRLNCTTNGMFIAARTIFLTSAPEVSAMSFFFFFKPECLSQGTAISSKSCFGSEGLRTQPLAHPPLPWNPGLRTIRLELMLSCSVFWSCPVSGLQTFPLPEETSSSLSSESLGLQGNQTGQS